MSFAVKRDLFHIFDTFQAYANRTITAILRYFFILAFIRLCTAYIILGSVLGSKIFSISEVHCISYIHYSYLYKIRQSCINDFPFFIDGKT